MHDSWAAEYAIWIVAAIPVLIHPLSFSHQFWWVFRKSIGFTNMWFECFRCNYCRIIFNWVYPEAKLYLRLCLYSSPEKTPKCPCIFQLIDLVCSIVFNMGGGNMKHTTPCMTLNRQLIILSNILEHALLISVVNWKLEIVVKRPCTQSKFSNQTRLAIGVCAQCMPDRTMSWYDVAREHGIFYYNASGTATRNGNSWWIHCESVHCFTVTV